MQVPAIRPGFARWLATMAAGGLLARFLYTLVVTPGLRGHGDAAYYHGLANALADGRGFVDPVSGTATALHPPLFSLLLALPSLVGLDSYLAHRAFVCLLGVGTVVAVGLVARRVAGDRAGLIAAALAAFSPVLISADSAVMSETLLGLLVALWLLVAYRPGRGVLLGVLIGLAALTRGEALLLLLAVPFVCRRWRESVVALLACLVVLAPWTVRNLSTFDRPVPISTNEGGLIAGANCGSTYHGHDIGSWDIRCVPHGPPEDESAASARARRAGLDYAGDHLGRVPLVVLARLGRTFELFQPVRQAQQAEGRAAGIEVVGAIFFLLLVPLGAYGALLLRRRGVAPWPLLAPLGIAVAATLIGYGVPRFRHPFDVALTVLAAVALAQLWPRRAQPAREGSQAASAAGPVAPPRSS